MIPIQAVLLDYGHTIVDFTPAEENLLPVYEEVCRMLQSEAEAEIPQARVLVEDVSRRVDRQIVESYIRGGLQELDIVDLFTTALNSQGLELPRGLVQRIVEMEHRALISSIGVSEANLNALRQLRKHGFKLGLVSNAALLPHLMHADIERLGIAQLLDAAVFSSEIGIRKPYPGIFKYVLDKLGVAPQHAVFVGDRLRDDLIGARQLGMRTVQTREFRQENPADWEIEPDLVIDRLPDLLPALRQMA